MIYWDSTAGSRRSPRASAATAKSQTSWNPRGDVIYGWKGDDDERTEHHRHSQPSRPASAAAARSDAPSAKTDSTRPASAGGERAPRRRGPSDASRAATAPRPASGPRRVRASGPPPQRRSDGHGEQPAPPRDHHHDASDASAASAARPRTIRLVQLVPVSGADGSGLHHVIGDQEEDRHTMHSSDFPAGIPSILLKRSGPEALDQKWQPRDSGVACHSPSSRATSKSIGPLYRPCLVYQDSLHLSTVRGDVDALRLHQNDTPALHSATLRVWYTHSAPERLVVHASLQSIDRRLLACLGDAALVSVNAAVRRAEGNGGPPRECTVQELVYEVVLPHLRLLSSDSGEWRLVLELPTTGEGSDDSYSQPGRGSGTSQVPADSSGRAGSVAGSGDDCLVEIYRAVSDVPVVRSKPPGHPRRKRPGSKPRQQGGQRGSHGCGRVDDTFGSPWEDTQDSAQSNSPSRGGTGASKGVRRTGHHKQPRSGRTRRRVKSTTRRPQRGAKRAHGKQAGQPCEIVVLYDADSATHRVVMTVSVHSKGDSESGTVLRRTFTDAQLRVIALSEGLAAAPGGVLPDVDVQLCRTLAPVLASQIRLGKASDGTWLVEMTQAGTPLRWMPEPPKSVAGNSRRRGSMG